MNRRVVSGTVAGVAALFLATVGSTTAAFDDQADVSSNRVGAGVLQLDLSDGSGAETMSFAGLQPGDDVTRRVWLARNSATSTVPATIQLKVGGLVDTAGPCATSRGKAEGDLASGITGCTLTTGGATGTPTTGVVSRLLEFRAATMRAGDARSCTADPAAGSFLPDSGPGNLARLATANTAIPVLDPAGAALVLAPAGGVCIALTATWPPSVTDPAHASPAHPLDNAAQGDSMSVQFTFQLTQVPS